MADLTCAVCSWPVSLHRPGHQFAAVGGFPAITACDGCWIRATPVGQRRGREAGSKGYLTDLRLIEEVVREWAAEKEVAA